MKNKATTIVFTLLRVVVFLLVLGFVLMQVSYFFRPSTGSGIPGYYSEPRDSLDVVYIGGSCCFTYWAPMEAWNEYGFTSYDFANNTIPPQVIKYCMIETLKTQSPQLVVVDLRPFLYGTSLNEDGIPYMYQESLIRNFSDLFKYSVNRFNMINAALPRGENPLEYHFDIAKYHTNMFVFQGYQLAYEPNYTKGFIFIPQHKAVELPDYSAVKDTYPIEPELVPIWEDLLDYCAGQNQRVLFIVPPYTQQEYDQMVYNYLGAQATAAGFDFLNTNEHYDALGLDPATDFYNSNHVNIFGAEKYTSYLAEYLVEHYRLPDKREDPAYGQWHQDYERWEQDVAEAKAVVQGLIDNPPQEPDETGAPTIP